MCTIQSQIYKYSIGFVVSAASERSPLTVLGVVRRAAAAAASASMHAHAAGRPLAFGPKHGSRMLHSVPYVSLMHHAPPRSCCSLAISGLATRPAAVWRRQLQTPVPAPWQLPQQYQARSASACRVAATRGAADQQGQGEPPLTKEEIDYNVERCVPKRGTLGAFNWLHERLLLQGLCNLNLCALGRVWGGGRKRWWAGVQKRINLGVYWLRILPLLSSRFLFLFLFLPLPLALAPAYPHSPSLPPATWLP